MNSNSALRIRIILALLCCFALVISFKLYLVEIVHGGDYIKKADSQYKLPQATSFDRGSIFFESKDGTRVGAATVKESYTLAINPKQLQENPQGAQNAYEALSQYIPIDEQNFLQKAAKPNDQYEEIQKKIDVDLGQTLASLKLHGVDVIKENYRLYPGGTLAAQTIGLVGFDSSNDVAGRYGLERFYQDVLNRESDSSSVNFFAELFANIKKTVFQDAQKEGDIVSTIDPTVQNYLEKELAKTQEMWKSDEIGGIIMNPKTGEIYSMAVRPTFDLNNLKDIKDPKVFSNPLVEHVYEMGSIIKPLTMVSGIDKGVITPKTTYDDTGFLVLDGKKISNYDGRARGIIPMQEVLNQSLNVGAATVALKVGREDMARYFTSFGLGEKTGIDQPNEQKGIVDNLQSKRDIEIATASYGQGIAMSPIATVRALSILANGGRLIKPHIIKEIDYTDGTVQTIEPDPGTPVIQKQSADTVTQMLVTVVDTAISKAHPGIAIPHYSIAAKTGTAQIADHVNGGYYSDRYLHSFFGYFPAYNPQYIVFLYQIYPKGAEYASETLTDPFIDIAKFLISYYDLPPDR